MGWDIIIEILFVLAIITFVLTRSRTMHMPKVKPLSDSLPGTMPAARDGKERELQAMEFRYAGDYDVSVIPGMSTTLRAYISPDGFHCASFIDVVRREEKTSILEFSSGLEPSGSITTSLSSFQRIFAHPPDKLLVQVPWMNTSGEVFQLHDALCQAALKEGYRYKDVTRLKLPELIRANSRAEMEYQVQRGRYRRVGEDRYRMTFLGAVIAVPLVWYNMCYGFLFRWYHPGKTICCWRLRRGLRRAARLRQTVVENIKEEEGAWFMPNITFDGPRIEEIAKKRELIKSVTEAAAKAYGLPNQAMIVLIKENSPENVGIGGELLADRVKK